MLPWLLMHKIPLSHLHGKEKLRQWLKTMGRISLWGYLALTGILAIGIVLSNYLHERQTFEQLVPEPLENLPLYQNEAAVHEILAKLPGCSILGSTTKNTVIRTYDMKMAKGGKTRISIFFDEAGRALSYEIQGLPAETSYVKNRGTADQWEPAALNPE